MKTKNITIGLDIGITSVGYSIIDQDRNILKMGVRLFDEPSIEKGVTAAGARRAKRGIRRLIRRRQFKLSNLLNMFVENKLVDNIDQARTIIVNGVLDDDGKVYLPFELKNKGLTQSLTKQELVFILYHYMHHRGWFYETDEVNATIEKFKQEMNIVDEKLFPCQYQLHHYNKYHKLNGTNFNDSFSNKDYVAEIEAIFKNQTEISETFKNDYLKLFTYIRDFATGPGNAHSPTPYGLYRYEKGKIEKIGDNLWTSLIGKCSVYKNLKRGLKNAPITELYNFVNDLNNLHFNRDRNTKLNLEEREFILNKFNNFGDKSQWTVTSKAMVKIINQLERFKDNPINEDNISGIKIDAKGKRTFSELNNLKILVDVLVKYNIFDAKDFDIFNLDLINRFNNLFEHVSLAQNDKQRRRTLLANNQWFPLASQDENVLNAINELANKLSGFSNTSSLSYKAMEEYLRANFDSKQPMNQMQYFATLRANSTVDNVEKTKYFKNNLFKDEILPTTTKRAFNQTIAVLNKILKLYGKKYNIENIVIEMARESNSEDERKAIKKAQDANKLIKDKLIKEYGISEKQLVGNNLLKVILWEQQEHKDIYTGENIDLETLISNVHAYHIEHIIPYSISFDNSKSNMVLTSAQNNKDKGNLTPWQWLNKIGKWKQYEERVLKCFGDKKEFKNKLDNLLYKNNPAVESIGFLERNLVDTRYASKLVLEQLSNFFNNNKHWRFSKNNNDNTYPLVKVINGGLTNYARYNLFIDENYRTDKALIKNRDIYNHHAVDASIIGFLGMNYNIQNRLKYISQFDKFNAVVNENGQHEFIDQETGEPLNFLKWKLQKDEMVAHFKQQLIDIINHDNQENLEPTKRKIGFSRLKSTKTNGQLSNETIYSIIPNQDNTKAKVLLRLNLFDEVKKLGKFFDKGSDTKEKLSLLCYQTDKRLFEQLQSIFYQYYENEKVNPFIKYMEDANKEFDTNYKDCVVIKVNDSFRKIKYLRYYADRDEVELDNVMILNKHINPNNNAKKQKRLAMMDSLKPFGARIYRDKNNKLVGFNININVLKYDANKNRLVIDQEKLNKKLDKLNVDRNAKYFELYRNQCFVDQDNNIWYSIGSVNVTNNTIEVKSLIMSNKMLLKKNSDRKFVTFNNILEWKMLNFDELGNTWSQTKIKDLL